MQYGAATRALAFLACVVGAPMAPGIIPRRDTVGATKQITTITADSATNDGVYGWTFTSTATDTAGQTASVSYTADSSTNAAEIVAGLKAAAYDSPEFMRFVSSIAVSSPDLAITLKEGQSGTFALVTPSSDLSQAATQAAAAEQAYTFGRAVEVVDGPDTTTNNEGVRPLQASTYTGPTITVTVNTADDGSDSDIVLNYTPAGGVQQTKTLSFTSTAAAGTSVDAAVTAAEALFPTATVTDNTTNLTIALPPGDTVAIQSVTNAGTLDVSATIAAGASASLPRCTIVAQDWRDGMVDQYPSSSAPTSTSGRAIPTRDQGLIAVAKNDTPAFDGVVYAETADGASKGLLYATASATRIPVLIGPERRLARFKQVDPHDSTLAHIQLGA